MRMSTAVCSVWSSHGFYHFVVRFWIGAADLLKLYVHYG